MKLTRLGALVSVLIVCAATWIGLRLVLRVQEAETDPERFSLIEDGLYQGASIPEPPPGVTAVLNLCDARDRYSCETALWEPIPDAEPAPDLDWLRRMVGFVDQQRREGKTVYVHCAAGHSRSGMVVVAYEMEKNGWTRDHALAFVRTKRPATRPNPAFMRLLLEWEKEIER